MSRSIEMLVSLDGDVDIAAIGFKGKACEKMTAGLEAAMGITKKKIKRPEYYQEEIRTQKVGG